MDYICDKCACEFEYNEKEESLCGGRLLSVCRYNQKTSPVVIGAKKHRDGSKISFMAYTLVQKITGYYETLPDVIVPVPIYYTDKIKKGYSHTEKICREISEITGIPTVNAVAKTRKTAQQKTRFLLCLRRLRRRAGPYGFANCKHSEHRYALDFRRIVSEKTWFFADSRRLRRRKTLRVLRV